MAPERLSMERTTNSQISKNSKDVRGSDDPTQNKIIEYLTAFSLTNHKYIGKRIDLKVEREQIEAFRKYINEKQLVEKLSRGMNYILWQELCEYENAVEAFGINAYEEQEGMEMVKRKRKERDDLKQQYRKLFEETVQQQTNLIQLKRLGRDAGANEPLVVARSSGHPSNSYVHGYGYAYGIGYTDDVRVSTAPGFELTATKHVQNVIKTISPTIGKSDFKKLYEVIFNFKRNQPQQSSQKQESINSNASHNI